MTVVTIVEGHGDKDAVSVLVRRFLEEKGLYGVNIHCLRSRKGTLLRKEGGRGNGIEEVLEAARKLEAAAILVTFDADASCLERKSPLGPGLEARCAQSCPDIPVRVVVANREFEAWFLNAWHLMFPEEGRAPIVDAESRPGCKSSLGELLGETYEPRIHQARLAHRLPFVEELAVTSRSYRRLLKVLEELAEIVSSSHE